MLTLDPFTLNGIHYTSFQVHVGNATLVVMAKAGTPLTEEYDFFVRCSAIKSAPKSWGKTVQYFTVFALVLYCSIEFLCEGLLRIAVFIFNWPEQVFKADFEEVTLSASKNILAGVFSGLKWLLKGTFRGLVGVIADPVNFTKEKGIKGTGLGVLKGLMGVFCKPCAGIVFFIGFTVQGTNNTQKSVIKRIYNCIQTKKTKGKQLNEDEKYFQQSFEDNIEVESEKVDNWTEIKSPNHLSEVLEEVQQRNSLYEQWIEQLSDLLNFSIEIPKVTSGNVQAPHSLVLEAKQRGNTLKNHLVALLKVATEDAGDLTVRMDDELFEDYIIRILGSLGVNHEQLSLLPLVNKIEQTVCVEDEHFPLEYITGDEPCMTPSSDDSIDSPISPVKARVNSWKPYASCDPFRLPSAHKKGGIGLEDPAVNKKLRDAGKEIIKSVGKKILRGDMNLTTVSFPIRCMQPASTFHNILNSMKNQPFYLALAAASSSPLDRMKLVVVGCLSTFSETSTFLKPLNPILGETFSAVFEDGSTFYTEQTSHHPPITHFHLMAGDKSFQMHGYSNYKATASLNSITIVNQGKRIVQFSDGQKIEGDFPDEVLENTLFGQLRHESIGRFEFKDEANELQCIIRLGTVKGSPTDCLEGVIVKKGRAVSKLSGTYLGYLDFDGVRYWDIREVQPLVPDLTPILPSDSENRPDLKLLKQGLIEEAQRKKEELEECQRKDNRLRHSSHVV